MSTVMANLLSLAELFLIIVPGIFFAKKKILTDEQMNGISSVVVNLTWPCLVVHSLQMEASPEILKNAGLLILFMCGILVISWLIAIGVKKPARLEKEKSYLFIYMLIFANTGFMGIPAAQALYGQEGVFYMALADSLSDVFVFSVGVYLMQKATGRSEQRNYKALLSPGVFSIAIGVILFLTGTTLPPVLGGTVETIGSATTPLAMLIVGYQLGKAEMKTLFTGRDGYLLAGIKLLALPLLVTAAMFLCYGSLSLFAKVVVLTTAMPAATCSVIFTEKYHGDVSYATKGVVLTTVLSIVTVPLITMFLEMIG